MKLLAKFEFKLEFQFEFGFGFELEREKRESGSGLRRTIWYGHMQQCLFNLYCDFPANKVIKRETHNTTQIVCSFGKMCFNIIGFVHWHFFHSVSCLLEWCYVHFIVSGALQKRNNKHFDISANCECVRRCLWLVCQNLPSLVSITTKAHNAHIIRIGQ